MSYTAADVKRLREATAAGMVDCKKALDEANGDFDKAVEIIRAKVKKRRVIDQAVFYHLGKTRRELADGKR